MSEEKNVGGRPPVSKKNEVINIIVPSEQMSRVRKVTTRKAATIAGWVRQAIEEKLQREESGAEMRQVAV